MAPHPDQPGAQPAYFVESFQVDVYPTVVGQVMLWSLERPTPQRWALQPVVDRLVVDHVPRMWELDLFRLRLWFELSHPSNGAAPQLSTRFTYELQVPGDPAPVNPASANQMEAICGQILSQLEQQVGGSNMALLARQLQGLHIE